jgi:hypothetical protein
MPAVPLPAGLAPTAAERWSHLLLRVDSHGRLALHPWLDARTELDAALEPKRWRLRVRAGGRVRVDSRSRLSVPIGIRAWLGLEVSAGISWRGDELVIWSPARLDSLLSDTP